jgi:hypothetical protein
MHSIAIVIYSKLEGAGNSAIYRALMFADELQRHGDDVVVVFDGAGTTAAAALVDPAQPLHRVYERVRSRVRGFCQACAKSYGVPDALLAAGLPPLTDDRGHASLRGLLAEGRQIVTF